MFLRLDIRVSTPKYVAHYTEISFLITANRLPVLTVRNVLSLLHTQRCNNTRLIAVIKYIITGTASFLPPNYWRSVIRPLLHNIAVHKLLITFNNQQRLHSPTTNSKNHVPQMITKFAAFHVTPEFHYRCQRNTPPVLSWKIHESLPVSWGLNSVKIEKYEVLTFFLFFRASCCLRYSHQHSVIQRFHLHPCLNVRLKILHSAVSSVRWIKSSFNFINVMCIDSCHSPICVLQLCQFENFNYIFYTNIYDTAHYSIKETWTSNLCSSRPPTEQPPQRRTEDELTVSLCGIYF
jgi:hypothetical protein